MSQRDWGGRTDDWEDDESAFVDREGPQECDLTGDSDDYEVVSCPHCGREISELAEQCPHCGDWITAGGGGRARWPLIVVAALLLLLVLLWAL
jgi:hypothetical protein